MDKDKVNQPPSNSPAVPAGRRTFDSVIDHDSVQTLFSWHRHTAPMRPPRRQEEMDESKVMKRYQFKLAAKNRSYLDEMVDRCYRAFERQLSMSMLIRGILKFLDKNNVDLGHCASEDAVVVELTRRFRKARVKKRPRRRDSTQE